MNRTLSTPEDATEAGRTPPAREEVAVHVGCLSCGYDVCGLDAAGKCPECGTDVELTLRALAARDRGASSPLWESDPRWLGELELGLVSALVAFALLVLTAAAVVGLPAKSDATRAIVTGLASGAAVASAFSAWKLGSREPGDLRTPRATGRGLRVLAVASLLVPSGLGAAEFLDGHALAITAVFAGFFAVAGAGVVFYLRVRDLAARLGRPWLPLQFTILLWFTIVRLFASLLLPSNGRPLTEFNKLLALPTIQFGWAGSMWQFARVWQYRPPDAVEWAAVGIQGWAAVAIAWTCVLVHRARRRATAFVVSGSR